eukprot:6889693-Alexandrium_andersonii.AAC.1
MPPGSPGVRASSAPLPPPASLSALRSGISASRSPSYPPRPASEGARPFRSAACDAAPAAPRTPRVGRPLAGSSLARCLASSS